MRAVFLCVQAMIWLPAFEIFYVHPDGDACYCTRGLHGHRKGVCTENWLREKNPLLLPGLEPESVLCLAFQLDILPTELLPAPAIYMQSNTHAKNGPDRKKDPPDPTPHLPKLSFKVMTRGVETGVHQLAIFILQRIPTKHILWSWKSGCNMSPHQRWICTESVEYSLQSQSDNA